MIRISDIKLIQVNQKTRSLSEQPDQSMLTRLRVLEQKMGFVLTLVSFFIPFFAKQKVRLLSQFKASVWGVINEQPMDTSDGYGDDSNSTIR